MVVVVPTPSLTKLLVIFHRHIADQPAADCVDTHLTQALHEGTHIIGVEPWVESSHAVEVTPERMLFYLAGVHQLSLKLIRVAQFVEGRDRGHHFHGRCGAHGLPLLKTIDGRVGCQVVHHQSHLRGLQQGMRQQFVQSLAQILRPRQRIRSHCVDSQCVYRLYCSNAHTVVLFLDDLLSTCGSYP